jgi:hypothetical protein
MRDGHKHPDPRLGIEIRPSPGSSVFPPGRAIDSRRGNAYTSNFMERCRADKAHFRRLVSRGDRG